MERRVRLSLLTCHSLAASCDHLSYQYPPFFLSPQSGLSGDHLLLLSMPRPPLSTSVRPGYDVSLVTDDEEEDERRSPPPGVEDSSGEDASDELQSAGGSPKRSYSEESGGEESDEGEDDGEESPVEDHFSSANEHHEDHTLSTGFQAKALPRPAPTSTSWKGSGTLKGTGPKILSGSSRRPRNSATYNLIALSRQARGYSSSSPKKRRSHRSSPHISASGLRRRSELPTYNLKELVQRTRGLPKSTLLLGKGVAERPVKRNTNASGQTKGHVRKWLGSDGSDYDDDDDDAVAAHTSKRRRVDQDTSIIDSSASEGPRVTEFAISKVDSESKSIAKTSWRDDAFASTFPGSSALLQYIVPWILCGGVSDPFVLTDDERITSLLALPKQRTIEWNKATRNRWSVSGKIDIVALLMQLTGEDSPSPCNKCTSDPEYGQWVGCKVMSSTMASEAWNIYGCANCVYHGKQTDCSLKSWNRQRATKQKQSQQSSLQKKSRDGNAQGSSAEDTDQSESSATETTTAKDKIAQDSTEEHPMYHDSNGATIREKPSQCQDISLVSADRGVVTPLMMEPWEKAPGRIRSRNSARMDNIAFSKSYLANGHEIPVCGEATFRVVIIRSGHVHHFKPQSDTTRLCSIASGKLSVNMDGEDTFTIGSHGMFRILPGFGCLVESEIYDDVIVHVTSINVEYD
ncbi:hypothetical protein VM1G_03627 [Cytospora mali]|uniref:Uncharacterized protein n=1 Tax=Cytospora mali TaxID=578113 RepID=A0A194VVM3_CYTMA|nr:hypothetical protein VM1G_03627 [Valsa mali]